MVEIPSSLAERLERGQVVLVAGLRCSRLAGAPGWEELALRLADRVDDDARMLALKELVAVGRGADAISYLSARLPRPEIAEVLREAYPARAQAPEEIVALSRIPWRGVITTGYDGLWALAADGAGPAAPRVFGPDDGTAVMDLRGHFLWQLAGLTAVPEGVALGAAAPPGAGLALRALAERWSFVFLGFRPGDPDLSSIGQLAGGRLPGGPHFLFAPGERAVDTDLTEAELGVTAVHAEESWEDLLRALHAALAPLAVRPAEDDIAAWLEMWGRDPDNPEPRVVLARAEARLREQRDWRRLVELLLGRVELGNDRDERVAVLRGLARIYGGALGAPDRAFTAVTTAFRLDPDAEGLLEEVERAAHEASLWAEMAPALGEAAARATDPARAVALRAKLGELHERRLDDAEGAVAAYEAVLAHEPDHRGALEALDRLYERTGRAEQHLRTLERLAALAASDAERLPLLRRLAAGWQAQPEANDRAVAALEQLVRADPRDADAFEALARLHRQAGRWPALKDALTARIALTENPLAARELWAALGAVQDEKLDDAPGAGAAYAAAVALGDERQPTLAALARLDEQAERWTGAVEALDKLALVAAEAPAKAAALVRAARIAHERLDDPPAAEARYARALELDADHVEALRELAALCRSQADLVRASDLMREAAARTADPVTRSQLLCQLGVLQQDELGDPAEATSLFSLAVEADPGNLAAAERLASLFLRSERWEDLEPLLETLARKSVEAHDALPATPAVLRGLGEVRARQGKWREAATFFQALVEGHRAALATAEIIEIYDRLGHCWAELGETAQAIDAYQEALTLMPGRQQTVHILIELYTAEKRWREAAGAWLRLAELEERMLPRAKCLFAAAEIYRNELGDPDWAVALFNRALDHAPGLTKAFDAAEKVLTETANWKALAQHYRKMIKRLPTEGFSDLRLRLWSGLGEVSLEQLGDLEMAVTALDVAASLDPGNVKRHEKLAEVSVQAGPSHADKAIAEHQWLIARNPDRLASYKALAKLYAETGAVDKLWCVSATLAFLRKANPEQLRFHEAHRPHEFRPAQRAFNDELWRQLAHPHEDPLFSALFMLLGRFLAAGAATEHATAGLRRKDRADLAADERLPSQVLRYLVGVLDLQAPDLLFQESDPSSLSLRNLQEAGVLTPALIVGKGIEQRVSETELVFEMAKRMAFLRPERFVRWAIPTAAGLEAAVRASLALGGVSATAAAAGAWTGGGPEMEVEVARLTADLGRLVQRPLAERVGVVARRLVAAPEGGGEGTVDVQGWVAAADLTAARVAFALTNDLAAAARVISTEPADVSPLPPKRRLKDLLAYSVSEGYFAVRKHLGLDVMRSAPSPSPAPSPVERAAEAQRRQTG